MRVLIVDDDPGIRVCLGAGLELAGHQVLAVGTASAAREALEYLKPDAAIIDGILPGHATDPVGPYGLILVREARSLGIPAVLHSGKEDLVAEARRDGIPALLKPAGITEILAALEAARPSGSRFDVQGSRF